MYFIGKAVPGKAKGIGTESVAFDDLGSGLQVLVVDSANKIGLGKIQFVVTAIDENSLGVKQRAHGPVAENG